MRQCPYVFDPGLCATPHTRLVCGAIVEHASNAPVCMTITAGKEALRRERIGTERTWRTRLRELEKQLGKEWGVVKRHAVASHAGKTAYDWFLDTLVSSRDPLSPYQMIKIGANMERYDQIDAALPEQFFDPKSRFTIDERDIVVEAFALDKYLVMGDHCHGVDLIGLNQWLRTKPAKALGIAGGVGTVRYAIDHMERTYDIKDTDWIVKAVAQSVVTDPRDHEQSAADLIDFVEEAGTQNELSEVLSHVHHRLSDPDAFYTTLEFVAGRGMSNASDAELRREDALNEVASQETGLGVSDFEMAR